MLSPKKERCFRNQPNAFISNPVVYLSLIHLEEVNLSLGESEAMRLADYEVCITSGPPKK